MKRFYRSVDVAAVEGGFAVRLDGRPVRTPAKALLVVPQAALADALAAEWAEQGDELAPLAMPLTRLANTAIDLTAKRRGDVVDALAAYAETDLLCHRAEQPAELLARQARQWQPLLDWAALRYDAALRVGGGVMPQLQPPGACQALRAAVAALDDWRLTALQSAVGAAGSLVLGLALLEGRIDAAAAFDLSQLDETYQIELWGTDAEAEKRRAGLRAELESAGRFARLLGEGGDGSGRAVVAG